MPIPTWFRFKGILSSDLGVVVMNYPPFIIPAERASSVEIAGRSGSLTVLEGEDVYKNITLSADCFVSDMSARNNIAAWLRGSGDLILGNNPYRRYRARIANQIDMSKVVRDHETRMFSVIFTCDPFQYEAQPTRLEFVAPSNIVNPSEIAADPVIVVHGNGNISLMVGSAPVSLTGVSGSATIDCDRRSPTPAPAATWR